jgi:hypothetical protein
MFRYSHGPVCSHLVKARSTVHSTAVKAQEHSEISCGVVLAGDQVKWYITSGTKRLRPLLMVCNELSN